VSVSGLLANYGKGGLAAVYFEGDKPESPLAWLGDLTGAGNESDIEQPTCSANDALEVN
jgi:hypothetical protein